MRFVIDSNEYIFAFDPAQESESARRFLDLLSKKNPLHTIRIPRTIFEKVRRNLSAEAFQEFNKFIKALTTVDEDFIVSFETVFQYEAAGFKPADTFIAAYAEYVGADILASENRHFLIHRLGLPFKVLTAEKYLNLINRPLK